MKLLKLIRDQREFSLKTFGTVPRLQGVYDHLRKEIIELIDNMNDLSEWADCFLLGLDGAMRANASEEELNKYIQLNCGGSISIYSEFDRRFIYQLKRDIDLLSSGINDKHRWIFIVRKIIVTAKNDGISSDLLIHSANKKLKINKKRNWPDWRTFVMKFKITNHFGHFQFWHMGCQRNGRESPMSHPKNLPEDVKEFRCVGCKKVGRATLKSIQPGDGILEEV